MSVMSWTVSGLYHIFRTKTVLRIPLPAKLSVFRTYIHDGDLCVVLRPLRDSREREFVDTHATRDTRSSARHNRETGSVRNDGGSS